jgi:hypothetical protein
MSRKDELIKFAETFHAHAKQAHTGAAKWALEKMSDEYRQEAARLDEPDKPRTFQTGIHADTVRRMGRRPNMLPFPNRMIWKRAS